MKKIVLTVAIATGLVSTIAGAADHDAKRPTVVSDVVHCRTLTDNAARLACYDGAVAALDKAESTQQIVVMDREQVRTTRRSLFGFSLPKINLFGGDKDGDRMSAIDTSVASVSHDADARLVFTTPEGATWHQIDDRPTFAVKRGTKVTIKAAALGSYFANFTGSVPVRVRRDK
ncbi:MAG TPA: hypothetical protein VF404_09335 [Sphingomonas sp.]